MKEPDYFEVRRYRRQDAKRFDLYPLTSDRNGTICERILPHSRRVLDVGSGDNPFLPSLKKNGFDGVYRTMDVSASVPCDYYSLDQVDGTFDAVLMLDVIEHLTRPDFYAYTRKILELLAPGGWLIITTPNPWSGTWVYADYTHISPWTPADLAAVLRCYGFEQPEITRLIFPSKYLFIKRLYWAVHSRFYDIDFAGNYLAAARKPHLRP